MYLEAIDDESALTIDELPADASAGAVLEIIDDVHHECVAAVMSESPPRAVSIRTAGSGYAPRPASALPKYSRPGTLPGGWS